MLVFAHDNLHLRERFQGFQIPLLTVPLRTDVELGINEGAEKFDADNFFIQAQRLKEGLEVKPFPRWAMG